MADAATTDLPVAQPVAERTSARVAAVAALGIVYGDLGTSPLYTLQTVVGAAGGHLSPATAMGILSLIFWALIITISVKYCLFVMRADNHGEGGILALMSLIGVNSAPKRSILVAMGLFGAALIYGDGMITPAISVLSALEGVNVATDVFKPYVLPLAAIILVALFAAQPLGTARIGKAFGPIMLLWFAVIAVLGVAAMIHDPQVLLAIDPRYALRLLVDRGWTSLPILGGVFLALTGGEALYADMGHFGRNPIRSSWYCVVLPALLLNYAGQIALLLHQPDPGGNPFFRIVPNWGLYPMVALSTIATIIASQAIITGSFSMTRQAMQLGWFPGLNIRQTSDQEYGQIYVPFMNWVLMVVTVGLAVGFGSSDRLAGAYGTAVSTTMMLTTILLFAAMRSRWGWSLPVALFTAGILLIVDFAFFSANLLKIADGGWAPLLVGTVIFLIMTTWRRGIDAVRANLGPITVTPEDFIAMVASQHVPRVPGTAVFLTRLPHPVSHLMVRDVDQFGALQQNIVSLTVEFEDRPRVPVAERVTVARIADKFWHVTAHFGFVEIPNLVAALACAKEHGCEVNTDDAVWFASRDEVVRSKTVPRLAAWRRMLFAVMYRNAIRSADRFDLPSEKFVEIGRQVGL
jgi:KUP system potassium uptake protein